MKTSLLIVAALVPMAALSALPALSAATVASGGRSLSQWSSQDNALAKAKSKGVNKQAIKKNARQERTYGTRADPYRDPTDPNLPSPPIKRRVS
jgi:hypothetical protein